jgi:hypothetical protein
MKLLLATAAAVSLLTTAAIAQETMGIGTYTCGRFDVDRRQTPTSEMVYFTWAQGFISATNLARGAVNKQQINVDSISRSDQQQMIRTYCDQNPQAFYADALMDLFPKFSPLGK